MCLTLQGVQEVCKTSAFTHAEFDSQGAHMKG